jgi:hypothetical protein
MLSEGRQSAIEPTLHPSMPWTPPEHSSSPTCFSQLRPHHAWRHAHVPLLQVKLHRGPFALLPLLVHLLRVATVLPLSARRTVKRTRTKQVVRP